MSIFSGIAVFFITWWISIFAILPWGLKRDERGFPNDPHLKRKIGYTTLLAICIWLTIYILIREDVIDFRIMSEMMMQKDYGR